METSLHSRCTLSRQTVVLVWVLQSLHCLHSTSVRLSYCDVLESHPGTSINHSTLSVLANSTHTHTHIHKHISLSAFPLNSRHTLRPFLPMYFCQFFVVLGEKNYIFVILWLSFDGILLRFFFADPKTLERIFHNCVALWYNHISPPPQTVIAYLHINLRTLHEKRLKLNLFFIEDCPLC